MRENELRVSLGIIGDLSPEQVAEHLGLRATAAWHQGEIEGRSRLPAPSSGLRFGSGLPGDASLAEHLSALWQRIEPVAAQIREIKADKVIQVWLYVYRAMPDFQLSARDVGIVAAAGAAVDIDVYYLADDADARNRAVGDEMRNRVGAWLELAGPGLDVEGLATALGLPDAAAGGRWRLEESPGVVRMRPEPEAPVGGLEEQAATIAFAVPSLAARLSALDCEKRLVGCADVFEHVPALHVGAATMRALAGCGLGLDVRVNYVGELDRRG